jgi:hypothetical protein
MGSKQWRGGGFDGPAAQGASVSARIIRVTGRIRLHVFDMAHALCAMDMGLALAQALPQPPRQALLQRQDTLRQRGKSACAPPHLGPIESPASPQHVPISARLEPRR